MTKMPTVLDMVCHDICEHESIVGSLDQIWLFKLKLIKFKHNLAKLGGFA
jgi:hypothetical protein